MQWSQAFMLVCEVCEVALKCNIMDLDKDKPPTKICMPCSEGDRETYYHTFASLLHKADGP